jgi:hypothetical protein
MSGRLLAIETRRSLAIWFAPPLVALAVVFARLQQLDNNALVWAWSSVQIRDGGILIGPGLAGAAAWMADRECRRGLGDLLATTAHPDWARRLATWAGATLWGVLAYAAAGAYIGAVTWQRAVWGAPFWSPILVGMLALPAHAALGFALGRALPGRFTAPLVAVGLFFLQVVVGWNVRAWPPGLAWLTFLSPVAELDRSIWYGVRPYVGPQQALILLGLTGLCLGSLALRHAGRLAAGGVMVAAAVLLVVGIASLAATVPAGGTLALQSAGVYGIGTPAPGFDRPLPYQLACSADPFPVCVHPAYQPLLAADSRAINRLAAPLLGLPGAPVRAEQRPASWPGIAVDVLIFTPADTPEDRFYVASLARDLVRDPIRTPGPFRVRCPGGSGMMLPCLQAQDALAVWLLRQAGLPVEPRMLSVGADVEAAVGRFAALDPAAQHAWLAAHYAALRRGEIRLEDLP